MSFSALPLAWREPPEAASPAASLLSQNPGASGASGVPPPALPTMFQELGPGPTPATLPPSAEPLAEASLGSAEPAFPLLSQKPGVSGASGVPLPLPPTIFQVLEPAPPAGLPPSVDPELEAWPASVAPAT
jgi:hypothetical protein